MLPATAVASLALGACLKNTSAGTHALPDGSGVPCDPYGPTGYNLTLTYHVPARCFTSPCGVIMNVHGFSMTAADEEQGTGMFPRGEAEGYIVIEPTAMKTAMGTLWSAVQDEQIWAVWEEALAVTEWKVDTSRLHFMGFSQGSDMTWRMYKKHPDVWASVACMSYGADEAFHSPTEVPAKQIPILYTHGVNDQICPYDGGKGRPPFPGCGEGAPDTISNLLGGWGIDNATGAVVAGDGNYTRTRWLSPSGVPFEHIRFNYQADYLGKGHCFPGSAASPCAGEFCCGNDCAYSVGEEVMKWFLKYPRAAPWVPPAPTPAPPPPVQLFECLSIGVCAASPSTGTPYADCTATCGK